jgi:hypothetical protein
MQCREVLKSSDPTLVYIIAAVFKELNAEFRSVTHRKLTSWKIENDMEVNKISGIGKEIMNMGAGWKWPSVVSEYFGISNVEI